MMFSLGRRGIYVVAVIVTAALAFSTLPAPQPADASSILQGDMIDLINNERAAHGLNVLTAFWDLEDNASGQTSFQVAKGTIFHTSNLAGVVDGGWSSLGENVGMGPSMPILHKAFMDSPGHRANILGDWSHIGISVKSAASGQLFITVIFMKARGSIDHPQPLSNLPVLKSLPGDAANSLFIGDIEWLTSHGIALGCDASSYCPDRPVTRGEMATMLALALKLPASSTDYFTDDNGSPHEANINAVAKAGITVGCNPPSNTFFCDQETLTREQMASFFVRALSLPTNVADQFGDDANSVHQTNINALGASGITRGCNPPANDMFCPRGTLTRGQIAAFLARAFG
ncbi:MAG: CAP domain-containing protein [Acidimicrobiia bacterium]|nr:CAP domain-containing protein [Acidimicrobiia bacterium]